jgi:RimJ/RimL family protein N-acetyltransferase
MCDKYFDADFTPCVDIGWRLTKEAWGKGLATEGAKRCLDYAFEVLNIEKIFAMAPSINIPSENVMKKIGMRKIKNFQHPLLLNCPELRECVLYQISAS